MASIDQIKDLLKTSLDEAQRQTQESITTASQNTDSKIAAVQEQLKKTDADVAIKLGEINARLEERFNDSVKRSETMEKNLTDLRGLMESKIASTRRDVSKTLESVKGKVDNQMREVRDTNLAHISQLAELKNNITLTIAQVNATVDSCQSYQEKVDKIEKSVGDHLILMEGRVSNRIQAIATRDQQSLADSLLDEITKLRHHCEDGLRRKADRRYVDVCLDGVRDEVEQLARDIEEPSSRDMGREATRRSTSTTDAVRESYRSRIGELGDERPNISVGPEVTSRVIHSCKSAELGHMPTFAGTQYEDPMTFICKMEDYFEWNHVTNDRRMILIDLMLKGSCQTWWDIVKSKITTLKAFKETFTRRYWGEDAQNDVLMEIKTNRYQKNNKTDMSTYFLQFVAKNRRLSHPLGDKDLVNALNKHFSYEVQDIVLSRRIEGITEMDDVLRTLDARNKQDKKHEDSADRGLKKNQDGRRESNAKQPTPGTKYRSERDVNDRAYLDNFYIRNQPWSQPYGRQNWYYTPRHEQRYDDTPRPEQQYNLRPMGDVRYDNRSEMQHQQWRNTPKKSIAEKDQIGKKKNMGTPSVSQNAATRQHQVMLVEKQKKKSKQTKTDFPMVRETKP